MPRDSLQTRPITRNASFHSPPRRASPGPSSCLIILLQNNTFAMLLQALCPRHATLYRLSATTTCTPTARATQTRLSNPFGSYSWARRTAAPSRKPGPVSYVIPEPNRPRRPPRRCCSLASKTSPRTARSLQHSARAASNGVACSSVLPLPLSSQAVLQLAQSLAGRCSRHLRKCP